MTAKEYVDEVMLRLSRYDVILELNEPLILTYINKGRQQAQRFTLESMPERYSRITRFPIATTPYPNYSVKNYYGNQIHFYSIPMPNDMIKVFRVVLRYTPGSTWTPQRIDARYYTFKEIFNTNVLSINPPTVISPIYTVMANNDNNYQVLISGTQRTNGNWMGQNTLEDILHERSGFYNIDVEIWYTVAIFELEYRTQANTIDNELTLPVPLDELVINYAMLHCLRHVKHAEGIGLLMKEIKLLESLITQNYELGIQKKDIELATYEG
jgi:hypothetical protein